MRRIVSLFVLAVVSCSVAEGGGSADEARLSTVPFDLVDNRIFIDVHLDGKGPFRFILDTGGHNAFTPEVSKELGLSVRGPVEVGDLRIGGIHLSNSKFDVADLNGIRDAMGFRRFDGIVGYEVFMKWVTLIDYEKGTLSFSSPASFRYAGAGVSVPFKFFTRYKIPYIDADIDGLRGSFWIDTGDRSSLTLLIPFVEKNRLMDLYRPRFHTITGQGTGGPIDAFVTRTRKLRFDGFEVNGAVTRFPTQRGGLFDVPDFAGNIGNGILKRFNLVVDYANRRFIFEKNSRYSSPDPYDRSGMWFVKEGRVLRVLDALKSGPAWKAGIRAGDSLFAIDGRDVANLDLPELRERLSDERLGRIGVRFGSGSRVENATLLLKDLLGPPIAGPKALERPVNSRRPERRRPRPSR